MKKLNIPMAKKTDTVNFLNRELDKKAKVLKTSKITEQSGFDDVKADKVIVKSKKVKPKKT